MKPLTLLLSCEHAGREVPEALKLYIPSEVLKSHRGYDIGALKLAQIFSETFKSRFFSQSLSRLVIEMNRSLSNQNLFSEYSKPLSKEVKELLIHDYYLPYRDSIEKEIKKKIEQSQAVLHLSLHTFTAVFNGIPRNAEIGLLYDSRREREKLFSRMWKERLKKKNLGYNIRLNYPYLGRADGLTSYLRKCFPEDYYLGIELEVCNALFSNEKNFSWLSRIVAEALKECLDQWEKKCLASTANPQIRPAGPPA